jgi:hypothetical protein
MRGGEGSCIKVLVAMTEGIHRSRWEDNIKMYVGVGWGFRLELYCSG